jgi:hypothetical protein
LSWTTAPKNCHPEPASAVRLPRLTDIEIQETCAGNLERLGDGEHKRLISNLRGRDEAGKIKKSNVGYFARGKRAIAEKNVLVLASSR